MKKDVVRESLLIGMLLFAGLNSGCITTLFEPTITNPDGWRPEVPVSVPDVLRPLQAGDQVEVTIRVGSAQPLQATDIIDDAGRITLPYLSKLKISQLTTSEAEEVIREAYIKGDFFRKAEVTVFSPNLLQVHEIYVTGEVNKKGSYPYKDGITLMQAIIAAGDRTAFASNTVKLIRNGRTTVYDIRKIRSGREADPVLMPKDVVEVDESWL